MKTALKIVVGLIIIVLIAAVALVFFGLNAAVRTGVEKGGSHVLKTDVTLDDVKLSPFSGKGTLSGLQVKNPEGFSAGNAFSLGTIHLEMQPRSLMSDEIKIDEIIIDNPVITYDRGLGGSNIGQLKENIERLTGDPKPDEEPAQKGAGKQVALKHFRMENGKVRLTSNLVQGDGVTLSLPKIELHDIGTGDKKATAVEVLNQVYAAVVAAVLRSVQDSDISLEGGKEALENLSKQAGEYKELIQSKESVEKATDTVKEGLKGFLDGDKDE